MSEPLIVGEGWLLVEAGSKTVLGRLVLPAPDEEPEGNVEDAFEEKKDPEDEDEDQDPGGLVLNPCYEIHRASIPHANGQVQIVQQAIPYGMFAHSTPVRVFPTMVTELGDLKEADRVNVRNMVKNAEDTKTGMRAQMAGITLAKA